MKNYTKFLSLFFAMALIIWSLPGIAQTVAPQYNNGTPNPSGGNSIPLAYSSSGCRGQLLYPAGIFANAPSGLGITDIYWMPYSGSSGSSTYSQLQISMGQPQLTSLSTVYVAGLTPVFTRTTSLPYTITYTGGNWFKITLDQPFPYDPSLPLLVEVNQLQSPFSNFYCATMSSGVPAGAYRNYSTSYNATSASGSGTFMNAFGFDLAPLSVSENDIGATKIDSPMTFCDGPHNVVATVKNFGINQVDTFTVNWRFNGQLQTPVTAYTLLDTFNGVGSNEAQVVLGQKTFVSNQMDSIEVWTSMPNNIVDTITSNDSVQGSRMPSMYGNFTIDPNGTGVTNYTNFSDLAKDLSDFGVCGPVMVTVKSGVYTEQVTFDQISGTSMINTITFVPDSGVVEIEYNSSNFQQNWVVGMNGASHISFTDFTFTALGSSYATCINFGANSNYNSFDKCLFNGYSNGTTSTYQAIVYARAQCDFNSFTNSTFEGGSYGFYYFGGGTTSQSEGTVIDNNTFNDQYYRTMYIYYSKDLKVRHNTLRSSRNYSSMYGIMSYYADDATEYVGNDIQLPGYTALYLYYNNGSNSDKVLVANNFIRSGRGAGSYGYGIYCASSGFVNIVHNTIATSHSSYTYYGIYVNGGANTILNNIVHDQNGYNSSSYGSLYYNGGFSVTESDYNNVYTNRNFGRVGSAYTTLADWQNGTGYDMHSLTSDPGFSSLDSLRTCSDTLDGAGTPVSYVTDDIDGDGRNTLTPDIGADEWVGSDSNAYSAGPDAIICDGKPAIIGLAVSGGIFSWSTGDTSSTIEVSTEGTYTVSMVSICGAAHSDTVEVEDVTPTAAYTINNGQVFLTGDFTNNSQNNWNNMWVVNTTPPDTFYSENLTYVFPDNGPYDVTLTIWNDCDTATITKTWTGTVGINDVDLNTMISVMPNPVSDVLTIQFEGLEGDVTVEMINIQGQLVHSDRYMNVAGNAVQKIDVSSLRKGMYIVKFMNERGVSTKQIIVQ